MRERTNNDAIKHKRNKPNNAERKKSEMEYKRLIEKRIGKITIESESNAMKSYNKNDINKHNESLS
jgi:hypothetical protein